MNKFQLGLRNAHYVEVKDIIGLTVYTNKYMTKIICNFYIFLSFVLCVLYQCINYVVFLILLIHYLNFK